MSAPYIIPFNFQPANTGTVLNGSYTVPSGKYARVVICLSAMARISASSFASSGGESFAITCDSQSMSAEFWLNAAEAVTTSVSSASGGPSAQIHSVSTATASIGGIEAARVAASASGATVTVGGGDDVTISGTANVSIRYEEYNIIS